MKKGFGVEKFWIKRVISLMLVALMLASTIQIDFDFESVAALPDSTVALGPNLASQVNEGTASASDDDGANLPGNANDNNTATYWLTTVSPTLPVTYEISWSGNGSLTFNSILILERYSGVALGMGNYGIEYWDGANWISVSNLTTTSSDYALPGTDEWGNCDFTSDARCEHLIQFDPVTAEKVRISVTSFATDGITTATRISFYEFMVFNNYSLASDATATADLEDGTDVASNAIDNDEDTWWQSTSSSTWLEVAWASTKEISSVEIVSGTVMAPPRNRVPADFDVEYWDGANWVSALAAAVSVNTSPDVTLLFTDTIKTTKLRLMITAVTSQPPRIREFRIFPPGPPGNIPTFGASPTQIQTGGQTSTISAELRDEDGNLVLDGTSVTFEEINGLCDAGFGGYPPSSNQEVGTTIDGVAQVTLFSGDVDCLSGPPDDRAQIRVSTWDATLGTTQRVDARVEILADLGIYFTVELYTWSAGTWTQLSSGDTVRAGRDIGVLVQAFDQFGNPKTDYTGTVTFSTNASNSPNIVDVLNPNTPPMLPPNAALTNGRFEWARNDNAPFDQVPADTNCTDAFNPATNDCFALYNAESGVTLTATDTLDPTIDGTSVDIEILSRPPSDLNNDLILEVPGSAVLGFSFSVTVTAVDRYGNTVKDYVYVGGTRGEVTFSSNDPFPATLPANYQFQAVDNGTKQFTVTMKSVGTWWLQVEDNIIPGVSPRPYWDQEDIDVSATSNITLSCLASPSQIPADGASQSTITANAQMGGSDVPNGTTINFEILPDALGTSLSSSEAITTGGNASVTLTSGLTIGTVTVRVFYDENFDDTWDATEPNATCDVNLYRGDETEFCAVGYGNVQGTIFWDRNRNGEFDPTIDVILQSEPFTDNNGNGVYDEGIDGFDPATQDVGFDGLPDSLTVDVYMPGNGVPPYFPFDYAEGNGKHDSVDIYIEDSTTPNAHATALGYSVSVPAGYTNGSDMGGYSYITVKAPGFYHQVKNIFVPLNGSVTLDFGLILFDAIAGKVTKSDGFPAEGVMITVIDSSGRQLTASEDQIDGLVAGIPGGYVLPVVVTDAFGNYVVKGLHDDTYKVMADNNEFMASTKSGIVVEYDETAVVNFENMSYCFGVIHGYVWESAVGTWRAAGGVEVSIPGLGLSTITDGSGQWLINNIPPGEYWVIAKKQGFTIGVQRVDVTECCDTAPIQPGDFWLEELEYCGDVACDNATVEGIVTDELGRPIEDAVVRFPGLEVTDFLRVPFPMRTDKAGYYIFTKYTDLKPQGAPGYDPDPWVSDSYYTYDSDGIPPGCYWIVVSDEVCQFTDPYDWAKSRTYFDGNEFYELTHNITDANLLDDLECDNNHEIQTYYIATPLESQQFVTVDFELKERMGYIFGQVTDTDGMPVSGALVQVEGSQYMATTDQNGYYYIELPRERYSDGNEAHRMAVILDNPGRPVENWYWVAVDDWEERIDPQWNDYLQLCCEDPTTGRLYLDMGNNYEVRMMSTEALEYLVSVSINDHYISKQYVVPYPKIYDNPFENPDLPYEGDWAEPGPGEHPGPDCIYCRVDFVLTKHTGWVEGQIFNIDQEPVYGGCCPCNILVMMEGRVVPVDQNGYWKMVNVPVGSYTAVVFDLDSGSRYGTGIQNNVLITKNTKKSQNLTIQDKSPYKGFVSGFVFDDLIASDESSTPPIPFTISRFPTGTREPFNPGEGLSGAYMTADNGATKSDVSDDYGFYIIEVDVPFNGSDTFEVEATLAGYQTNVTMSGTVWENPRSVTVQYGTFNPWGWSSSHTEDFAMLKQTGVLAGYVKNGSVPLQTSVIRTFGSEGCDDTRDDKHWGFTTYSDDAGYYQFATLPQGYYWIRAYQNDHLPEWKYVYVGPSANQNFDLEALWGIVEGRMFEDTTDNDAYDIGEELPNAEVTISGGYAVKSDWMGYFIKLKVPFGRYTVVVKKAGYGIYIPISNPIMGACERIWLSDTDSDLYIYDGYNNPNPPAPGAGASSVVFPSPVDNDGIAMVDAVGYNVGMISGWVTVQDGSPEDVIVCYYGSTSDCTETDAQGYYILVGVPAGTYYMDATKTGWNKDTRDGVVVMAGQETTDQNFHLTKVVPGSGTLVGEIIDCSTSSGINGAQVTAYYAGTTTQVSTTTTDSNGYFTMSLKEDTYDIKISKTGFEDLWVYNVQITQNMQENLGTNCLNNIPKAPENLLATVIDNNSDNLIDQIDLSWDEVTENMDGSTLTNFDHYNVYEYDSTDGSTTKIGESTSEAYTDGRYSGQPTSNQYCYVVTTVTIAGIESANSNVACTGLQAPTLSSPSNGATNESCPVSLSWSAVGDATSYDVQVATDSAFTSLIVDDNTTSTSYEVSVSLLQNSTTYWWRVRSRSSTAVSAWSEEWSFTTASDCTTGAAGINLEGYVKDGTGTPIDGVTITVYRSGFLKPVITDTTDSSGYYGVQVPTSTLYDLTDGAWFTVVASKSGYITRYATRVMVDNTSPATQQDFKLSSGGSTISGSVDTGSGVVIVAVKDDKGNFINVGQVSYSSAYSIDGLDSTTKTAQDSSGNDSVAGDGFYVTVIPSGSYKIETQDNKNAGDTVNFTMQTGTSVSLSLQSGYNLFSMPVNVSNDSYLPFILYSIDDNYNEMWRLIPGSDSSDLAQSGATAWETYPYAAPYSWDNGDSPERPTSDAFDAFEVNRGYWINTDSAQTLTVIGDTNSDFSIELSSGEGFYLIGFTTNNIAWESELTGDKVTYSVTFPNDSTKKGSVSAYETGNCQHEDGTSDKWRYWGYYITYNSGNTKYTWDRSTSHCNFDYKAELGYYIYAPENMTITYSTTLVFSLVEGLVDFPKMHLLRERLINRGVVFRREMVML